MSFCPQGACLTDTPLGRHPPGRHPLGRHPQQTPPLGRHPQGCSCFAKILTVFKWTYRNLEFRRQRMWSLNRQLQCKSVKIYWAQTPQNLVLTKILHKLRKTSTPLGRHPRADTLPSADHPPPRDGQWCILVECGCSVTINCAICLVWYM